MEQCNFKVKVSLKDYRAFNFHHSYGSCSIVIKIMPLIIAILYPVLILMYFSRPDKILLAIIIIAGLGIFASVVLVITIYLYSKKVFDSDKYLQEEQYYKVDEKEINVRSRTATALYLWEELYKCVENTSYFYIYTANIKAILIPKRQLTHSEIGFLSSMCKTANGK